MTNELTSTQDIVRISMTVEQTDSPPGPSSPRATEPIGEHARSCIEVSLPRQTQVLHVKADVEGRLDVWWLCGLKRGEEFTGGVETSKWALYLHW